MIDLSQNTPPIFPTQSPHTHTQSQTFHLPPIPPIPHLTVTLRVILLTIELPRAIRYFRTIGNTLEIRLAPYVQVRIRADAFRGVQNIVGSGGLVCVWAVGHAGE